VDLRHQLVHELVRLHIPEPVERRNPEVPKRLAALALRMLEKDPTARPPTLGAVLQELQDFLDSGHGFGTRTYAEGQVIFREGDPGNYAFMVVSGSVEIAKQTEAGPKRLATLGSGEFIGELSIFSQRPRTATATAVERTVIRIMKREDVESELEKLSPWVGTMIRSMSDRFVQLNQRLIESDDA
jgi:CRP-like cAMP-binding protein